MKYDSKLSSVLHLLLHMAHSHRPLTSETLAGYLHSHAVVVRRALGGLRDAGFVASERGHGGGWVFACDLHTVILHDIYDAVGSPPVFAIGNREDNPACLVEQAVNEALGSVLREAEALLIERLGRITLAELSSDFNRRFAAQPRRKNLDEHRTKPQRP